MPSTARRRAGVEAAAPHDERRRFVRHPFDEKLGCFIDGARLHTHSENLSEGGIFLRTDASDNLPVGTVVGIVFTARQLGEPLIFLFGRVVRVQTYPRVGVGLAWVRAVTAGSRASLKSFLGSFLRLPAPEIVDEPWGGKPGVVRSVYVFPTDGASEGAARLPPVPAAVLASEPEAPPPAMRTPSRRPLTEDRPYETGRVSGRGPGMPFERVAQPPREPLPRPAPIRPAAAQGPARPVRPDESSLPRGPVIVVPPNAPIAPLADPQRVAWAHYIDGRRELPPPNGSPAANRFLSLPDFQALVSIPATLTAGRKRVAVRILRLGATSMFVGTEVFPIDRSVPVKISFDFAVATGAWAIDCSCHVVDVDDGALTRTSGLGLHVISFDAPEAAGVLCRYVRFLHHEAFTST